MCVAKPHSSDHAKDKSDVVIQLFAQLLLFMYIRRRKIGLLGHLVRPSSPSFCDLAALHLDPNVARFHLGHQPDSTALERVYYTGRSDVNLKFDPRDRRLPRQDDNVLTRGSPKFSISSNFPSFSSSSSERSSTSIV
ncbi:hypothetical protein L198_05282 [Cryptococcus wingfieldii CBS 7118]|uniref:Uncharacterized protein n=1 Tax=Cryptococcus wingfieldii CBS 7118 TaxID=1295528 RepID=A0A1E3IXZ7_9TREE|nr:hypothetical protein L198_05282 [Cryptococcus wingfieldii CBS 7118]ODN93418.1 hypothetical protein L198_05282 [Cryptococcus wingfieldii CBS 7118]